VVRIHLPALRERIEDVPLFTLAFIDYFNRDMGKSIAGISPEAMNALKAHDWPGNIRELRNVIERAAVFCSEDQIELGHLPREILDGA
jgi:DNA-binding NtrC family response regulator